MLRFFILTVLLCFATASFGAGTKTKLALNWKPEPQFGGFYAADFAGEFKKQNLEVEILPGGAGTPVVQMIAAGQVDFGIVSADEVILSRVRGGDVVALYAAFQTNPQGILVHGERGLHSIGDVLKNEGTLAMQKGLPYAMYLLKKYPQQKVKVVPYLGGIANFLNDKTFSQQCFVTSEPLAAAKALSTLSTKPNAVASFLVADEGYNPYTTVLATRGDVLKKNPELVKAVVAAVRAGWQGYLKDPKATNEKMAKMNKAMDLTTFNDSSAAQLKLVESAETKNAGLGVMTEERWKTLALQLVDLKVIDKAPETKSLYQNF